MQNPFQTILRFQNFFDFFQKIIFFHCFEPYTAKMRNMKSEKNHLLVLFYSAKSNSDHFTISNFSSFSPKNFFLLFRHLYCTSEKNEVSKNKLWVLSYGAKTISDHFRNSIFFQSFEKIKFLASTPHMVNALHTLNLCKISAKLNA